MRAGSRAGWREALVYAASSTCYGFPDAFPTPEDAAIWPQYPYALTKYLGEVVTMHWALAAAASQTARSYADR